MAKSPHPKARAHPTYFRQWREHRGLTQEQAAERMGIAQATLSRIERGAIRYGQDFIEAAAFAYNCEPADLLIRDPSRPDAVWTLADHLRRATPEQQGQIQAVVEALLRKAS